jgi:RNA polymerase sigma factor (sigma-70 family)
MRPLYPACEDRCQILVAQRDPSTVTGSEREPLEGAIRRFVLARDAGDAAGAALLWERLVVDHKDRVRVWVAAWSHPGNGQRLPAAEYDDATQRALIAATLNMLRTFRGSSAGELRAALRTCTEYAAHNHWRAWVRHARHAAGSIDEPLPGGEGGAGRFDRELAADELQRRLAEEGRRDLVDLLDDAIARVPSENQRRLLAMDRLGVPDSEIAEVLDVSIANVYKLRERGLKKLKEVLGDGSEP